MLPPSLMLFPIPFASKKSQNIKEIILNSNLVTGGTLALHRWRWPSLTERENERENGEEMERE